MIGNYNNSSELFRNARDRYRRKSIKLIIAEGHVVAGSDGIVARFDNNAAAIKCLVEAGYSKEPSEVNLIFNP